MTEPKVETANVRAELERRAASKAERDVRDLLARMEPELAKLLPDAIGPERFTRIVMTELRRTPKLYECRPESLLGAMMLCAQLGLEPGPLGYVYLVPFERECTFILGYRGMVALAYRSGQVKDVIARTVYEGDEWTLEYGIRDRLLHRLAPPAERGQERAWYGLARLKTGGHVLHALWPEEVEAIRKRSPAARAKAGPWVTDYNPMACKSVLRQMARWLPLDAGLARAVERDEAPVTAAEGEALLAGEEGEAT